MRFAEQARAGVVVVNGGTHGSEPHMGFGGVKQSGTGWREAGVEALDVYSDWKYVNLIADVTRADGMPSLVAFVPARTGSERVPGRTSDRSPGIRCSRTRSRRRGSRAWPTV